MVEVCNGNDGGAAATGFAPERGSGPDGKTWMSCLIRRVSLLRFSPRDFPRVIARQRMSTMRRGGDHLRTAEARDFARRRSR